MDRRKNQEQKGATGTGAFDGAEAVDGLGQTPERLQFLLDFLRIFVLE